MANEQSYIVEIVVMKYKKGDLVKVDEAIASATGLNQSRGIIIDIYYYDNGLSYKVLLGIDKWWFEEYEITLCERDE